MDQSRLAISFFVKGRLSSLHIPSWGWKNRKYKQVLQPIKHNNMERHDITSRSIISVTDVLEHNTTDSLVDVHPKWIKNKLFPVMF